MPICLCGCAGSCFNTSHVVVYHSRRRKIKHYFRGFNTSHVVVYLCPTIHNIIIQLFQYISCCSLSCAWKKRKADSDVSIHLMLQFIQMYELFSIICMSFNTSHVVVYLIKFPVLHFILHSFNTSHVVVYRRSVLPFSLHKQVSIHLMLQFIGLERKAVLGGKQFQYISCCSLSQTAENRRTDHNRFQYISCCSLSSGFPSLVTSHSRFQYISCCSLSSVLFPHPLPEGRFNTSHVVVYHERIADKLENKEVSIHLMLQFIKTTNNTQGGKTSFNTSHVVVYLTPHCVVGQLSAFQYISCCSLSNTEENI